MCYKDPQYLSVMLVGILELWYACMLSQCASSITLLLFLELMCALQRINFALIKNWQNFKLPAGVEHFFVTAIVSKTTQMGCLFAIQTPLPHEKKKGWVHGERSPQDSRVRRRASQSMSGYHRRLFDTDGSRTFRSWSRALQGAGAAIAVLACLLASFPSFLEALMHACIIVIRMPKSVPHAFSPPPAIFLFVVGAR